MSNAVRKLQTSGTSTASAVAEHARKHLMSQHPALERMALSSDVISGGGNMTLMGFGRSATSTTRDPIAETRVLSAAMGAWFGELLWNAPPGDGTPPERFLEDLLRERRHMFQGAGLFEALPWRLFV
jgi:hypothetical protein